MINSLAFFIGEALLSIRRGALMNAVAVGTISVALTVFGIFLLLTINLGNLVGTISSRLDMSAYVNQDISVKEAAALQVQLSRIPGVEKVDYISREESWEKFKKDFGANLNLDEAVDKNPLPHTFAIRVRKVEDLSPIAKKVSQVPLIDDVRYSGKLIDQMKTLVSAVKIGGITMVLLLVLATLLIVVNTIRLTVLARKTDIEIMRLVGGTRSFIKWPFIIEGLLLGVTGSLISVFVLKFSYDIIANRVSNALPFLPIVTGQGLVLGVYFVLVFSGTALGLIGGYISISKELKEI